MARRFTISDTHFGHTGILRRPHRAARFSCVEQMNEVMVENWNSVVNKRDTVFLVGDFTMHNDKLAELLVERLNGHIVIIAGNHDDKLPCIEHVYGALHKNVNGHRVIMTHIPIHPQEFYRWEYNIHGHLHEKHVWTDYKITKTGEVYGTKKDPRYINVSVEQLNYTPIELEKLIPA